MPAVCPPQAGTGPTWDGSPAFSTTHCWSFWWGVVMGGVKSPVLFCQGRVWPPPPLCTSFFILSLLVLGPPPPSRGLECWQPQPRDCEKEMFLVELLIVTSPILSRPSSLSWRRSWWFVPSEGLGLPDRVVETALNGKPRNSELDQRALCTVHDGSIGVMSRDMTDTPWNHCTLARRYFQFARLHILVPGKPGKRKARAHTQEEDQ